MKLEMIGDNFIINGEIQEIENTDIFKKIKGSPIYEVIRVIEGVPLFFEEHFNRMKRSADIIQSDLGRNEEEIKQDIIKLIKTDNINNKNIKLISAQISESKNIFIVYQIESFYPPEAYYTKGIHTILIDYERENPNAKILHSSFKEKVKKELEAKKAFEALLVNKSGNIAGGSRSNIFYIYKDKVYTAKSRDVLLGVTRLYIFNICKKLNIDIIEKDINISDISKLDAAFMTGTSVNVLPISTIDEIKLNFIHNKIIREINNQYRIEMKNYILKNRNKWN